MHFTILAMLSKSDRSWSSVQSDTAPGQIKIPWQEMQPEAFDRHIRSLSLYAQDYFSE
jgi:hypothetical protein